MKIMFPAAASGTTAHLATALARVATQFGHHRPQRIWEVAAVHL